MIFAFCFDFVTQQLTSYYNNKLHNKSLKSLIDEKFRIILFYSASPSLILSSLTSHYLIDVRLKRREEVTMATATKIELAVDMTCQTCVDKATEVLSNEDSVLNYKISLQNKSVVCESTMPSAELVDLIERKTGKRAVIMGSGEVKTLAAVAMLGGIIGCGSVQVNNTDS